MHVNGGGVYNRKVVQPRSKPSWLKRPVYTTFFFPNGCRERQGLVGSLRKRPTRRARLRSRTTASSGMHHIASSCTSYTQVYLATRGCLCSPVGPRRAPARSTGKRAGTITRNAYTHGKGELAWDTWPNRLVLRPSL